MTTHSELELAHRYVARTLDPAAVVTFEDHLIGCTECQAEVTLAAGLRQIAHEESAAGMTPRRWIMTTTAWLAAAAVVGFVVLSSIDSDLEALGAVTDPPAYVGVAVRALPAQGDSLFAVGMDAYNARRYSDAARDLAAALRAGVDTVPTEFFLASAQLMAGHHRDAVANYGRVISAGVAAAPYLGEAHLFRARALLRLGRANEALADLRAIDAGEVELYAAATALADSVTRVIAR